MGMNLRIVPSTPERLSRRLQELFLWCKDVADFGGPESFESRRNKDELCERGARLLLRWYAWGHSAYAMSGFDSGDLPGQGDRYYRYRRWRWNYHNQIGGK